MRPASLAAEQGGGARHRQRPAVCDAKARALLDEAARTATRIGHVTAYSPASLLKHGGLWYPGRHWINVFPGNANFTSNTFDYIDAHTSFTYAYSASPARNRFEWSMKRQATPACAADHREGFPIAN